MSKDLQRNLGQEAKFQTSSILAFTVAVAVLAAMTYVQRSFVPGSLENAVRTCANFCGLLAVPVLLILGFRNWHTTSRANLPAWRNGIALSSIVLPSLVWVSRTAMSIASAGPQIPNHALHIDPLALFATLLNSNLLAGLLTIALTGKSRLLVLSSVLLLWAGLQSDIYF